MQLQNQPGARPPASAGGGDLADILERVLDKGIVVAGDVAINLLDIELLTIKLRLLIASADTAKKMGIDWWESDPFLSGKAGSELPEGNGNGKGGALEERLDRIENALAQLAKPPEER
ncbi:MAG TPA: gas vesicle protein [Actinomycetota bacterium]|nr:gas vesicle protein [Actinomycetota bacterium]